MKAIFDEEIAILPVEGTNLIDVFQGNGWSMWSRFQIVKGHPRFLKGESLTTDNFKRLCELVK